MVKETETTQIGLRIDTNLLKEIDEMAEYENIDRMSWIRRALATFLKGEQLEAKNEAIENYVELIIDENKLKEILALNEIPIDLKKAREETLNKIKGGKKYYGKHLY